jgi:hypothetical protein
MYLLNPRRDESRLYEIILSQKSRDAFQGVSNVANHRDLTTSVEGGGILRAEIKSNRKFMGIEDKDRGD